MAIGLLRRLAAEAPVPVFAAVGAQAADPVAELLLSPAIEAARSPRHATLLLVAGEMHAGDQAALERLHDQLPPPRATVCWGAPAIQHFEDAVQLPWEVDPLPRMRELYRQLLHGEHPSEPDRLPDEPPAAWRGVGEHGQGGKGMMGGVPYGRPMAMTANDLRDGLALDVFTLQIGPFLPVLPAGLILELTLQGDLIQQARMVQPPSLQCTPRNERDAPLLQAARRLRLVARVLDLLELRGPARHALVLAQRLLRGEQPALAALHRQLRYSGAWWAIPPGLARFAEFAGGSPAQADTLDVRGRLRRWLTDIDGLLHGKLEAPALIPVPRTEFEQLLAGLEWNEAMLTIASFDPLALRIGYDAPPTTESAT